MSRGRTTNSCPTCGKGRLRRRQYREVLSRIDLGTYRALVCDACGDAYLGTEAMAKIEARAKRVGLWGSPALRFIQLSRRKEEDAQRKGLSRAELLLRALKQVRKERP